MEQKQKEFTVWQRLSNTFGPNSLLNQDYPTYKIDKDVLLKTNDRLEYEKQKLQAQQTLYLAGQWTKIENNLYTQAVYYEPTRLASFYDYESMEFTPEISTALDIYSEESTTPDKDGKMLQIYSESKRIKTILEDLFYNALDLNTNLPMWIRNTCKYGDNFVYLKLDPEKGIVGCMQLPNIEIERLERGMAAKSYNAEVDPKQKGLRFHWKTKDMEFNTWEVAHFRLLGDDRKLPYGTSMLEKARRIWKQLMLAEDAMLIYRTARAPERRVFKVYVGNMDDKDVEPYVQRVANKFKRDQVVDSKTGNVDMRYNQMAVDQDYFVPVRDPAAPSPIDTLPGGQNMSEIADIEYIQKKLVTALRIPKAYLGFEEVVGDGKNLSLLDIRFARTINKIQKAVIAELNKIAIIHLFLMGFEDELQNFTLGLTNPSKQADLLMIEVWKAVSAELDNTATIITRTGMFDIVDKLYKPITGATQGAAAGGAPPPPPGGDMGGGAPPPPAGGPEAGGAPLPEQTKNKNYNLLVESDDYLNENEIDLFKANTSLGAIEEELLKILKD